MPLTATVDRYLDRLQDRLPALPASALRVQRKATKRLASLACRVASTVRGPSRDGADLPPAAVSTATETAGPAPEPEHRAVADVQDEVQDDVVDTSEATDQAPDPDRTPIGEAAEVTEQTVDQAPEQVVGPDRAPAAEPYEALTKKQLYARAAALDIPGRSSMSKAELIAALRSSS